MAIEVNSERTICAKCGTAYGRRKGYFPVSYAVLHKGIGYIPVCKDCIDKMYNTYLAQCNDAKSAVRQMCRKLDLFWSENVYEIVSRKNSPRSMMTQYIAKINSVTYAGKSYDDTLSAEGTLWSFGVRREDGDDSVPEYTEPVSVRKSDIPEEDIDIPDEVKAFWGSGYSPEMYQELEQRRQYLMSKFPGDVELDIGAEALIRQICALELDINRDRSAGRSVEKSVTALNALLGSANLKPVQKKQDDDEAGLTNTPLGVWLFRYENKRPLPEIDDDLKDVNGLKKYIFIWMGHLCKMLGLKNTYSQLYEEEVDRLRVEMPEYDGEDDESIMIHSFDKADNIARSVDNGYAVGGDENAE